MKRVTMKSNITAYFYDSILDKNVYGVVPKTEEVCVMESIVELYNKLTAESKEYLLVRLEILKSINE